MLQYFLVIIYYITIYIHIFCYLELDLNSGRKINNNNDKEFGPKLHPAVPAVLSFGLQDHTTIRARIVFRPQVQS